MKIKNSNLMRDQIQIIKLKQYKISIKIKQSLSHIPFL